MPRDLHSLWNRLLRPRRRQSPGRVRLLAVERLEDRTLLSGNTLATATVLPFTAFDTAHVAAFLNAPAEADLYRVTLGVGDQLTASVSAQTAGSGLQSLLRVFDAAGKQLALDDQKGGDPRLTFQPATPGDYFVGVSSGGNDNYNPTVAGSGSAGATTGLYSLDLRLTPGAAPSADLTGGSFRLRSDAAAYGDTVGAAFTVENRGGKPAGAFDVQVLLSNSNAFTPASSVVLKTFSLAGLDAGGAFSSGDFTVTLPDRTTALADGLPGSGPVYLGLRIDPAQAVPELDPFAQSGVHRGADWEALTIVTPLTATGTNQTPASAQVFFDPNNRVRGTVSGSQVAWYRLTLAAGGLLTASVTPDPALAPRLVLYGADGQVPLAQTDSATPGQAPTPLAQHLQAGTYFLTVSAQAGAGDYQLTSEVIPASTPSAPLASSGPRSVLADVNGDGFLDLIAVDNGTATVGVSLGNGDGTFRPQHSYAAGVFVPNLLAVADVNGDGRADLIVSSSGDKKVNVFLGNGDGTFQSAITTPLAVQPGTLVAADLTGDGKADLVFGADDSIAVLVSRGDGTFQAQAPVPGPAFPGAVAAVADVNGDGKPDLVVTNFGSPFQSGHSVSVLLGNGDGSLQAQQSFTVGSQPDAVAVADLDGNGKPDLVVANSADNTVSVLRNTTPTGATTITFEAQQAFAVGTQPNSVAAADVNGDGQLDLIVANEMSNNVSVLLANGGSFQPQRTFAAGGGAVLAAVADVNGDGKPDLLVTNFPASGASVLLGNGDGSFVEPQSFATGLEPTALVADELQRNGKYVPLDVNGDGRSDLVVLNAGDNTIGVFLGNGDGSFQPQRAFAVNPSTTTVLAADVNGDGRTDLVVASTSINNGTVGVLLGNGDGTFQPEHSFSTGTGLVALAIADVTGDGKPDLLLSYLFKSVVSVLPGKGDGTFGPPRTVPVSGDPTSLAAQDVNGDSRPDIIFADFVAGKVSVLLNDGKGGFQPQQTYDVGANPSSVTVADVNGDGKPDLITTNQGSYYSPKGVSVLLNQGGTFGTQQSFLLSSQPTALAVADVNGDGKPDLAIAYSLDHAVGVLAGNGDGTFAHGDKATRELVGLIPNALALADVNGDGRPDILVANEGDSTVSVLLTAGGGRVFGTAQTANVGHAPRTVAVADVNNDGIPDLVTANRRGGTVSVVLGQPGGGFGSATNFPAGSYPNGVAVADVNGDGFPDLVTANYGDNQVAVLLGDGTGSFTAAQPVNVDAGPLSVVLADVNGDGFPDIITANYSASTVSVALGQGNGTFGPAVNLPTGPSPNQVAVADVNGDGFLDVITANYGDGTVSVLLGNGDGTFRGATSTSAGAGTYAVTVADLNGDGKPDIVTANGKANSASILLGKGDGTFLNLMNVPVGSHPQAVAVADLNGDGRPDLIAANYSDNTVSVLPGNGDGTFQPQETFATGAKPTSLAVADLNGDGSPDLAVANLGSDTVSVLPGGKAFTAATPATGVGLRDTPLQAPLDGDTTPDSVVLDRAGNILFRRGLPEAPGQFAAPTVINPNQPARDLALVRLASGWGIAAADVGGGASIYAFVGGAFTQVAHVNTGPEPVRIAAADLHGDGVHDDGLGDLVIADGLDNSVTIAFQGNKGQFTQTLSRRVGVVPSDLALTTVADGDTLKDIVVSDQVSGDVAVLFNDATHAFATSTRFRATAGPAQVDGATGAVSALGESVSLASGNFTGTGRNDLVVVNRAAHSFSVLANDGSGGFAAPQTALTTSTSSGLSVNDQPGAVVAADFHGTDGLDAHRLGNTDLAVLMEDRGEVWVYTNQGDGSFQRTFTIGVGAGATGLSVVPGARPGLFDVLVGNTFGDVLRLVGKGDGTFQPPPPFTGNRVPLSVVSLQGNGQPDVLLANQQADSVSVQAIAGNGSGFAPVQKLAGSVQAPLRAPGAVQWFKLEGDSSPFFDAVVLASGSNAMLVYRGTGFDAAGRPTFAAPQTIPVGTNPAGVTIADLNGDGVPDMLVANQGSNDVSVLFGHLDASGHWFATAGPRLSTGGSGPVATTLRDLNGDGIPDLVVTNGQSGTFSVLPGVGQGFFNDTAPRTLPVPGNPTLQPPEFFGNSDAGLVVTGDGRVMAFNLDNFAATIRTVVSGVPVAAVATLNDGGFVTADAAGSVNVLEPDGQSFTEAESLTPLTGLPADPSALDVLEASSGLQALVTSQGQDQVFVFATEPSGSAGAGAGGVVGIGLPALASPGVPIVEATAPNEVPFAIVLTEVADILGGSGPVSNALSSRSQPGNREDAGAGFSFITTLALDVEEKTKDDPGEPDPPPPKGGIGLGVEEPPKLNQPPVPSDPDGPLSRLQRSAPGQPGFEAPTVVDGFSGEWLAAFLPSGSKGLAEALGPVAAPQPVAEVEAADASLPTELDSRQADAGSVEEEDAVGPGVGSETEFEEAARALSPLRPAEAEGWGWPVAVLVALSAAEPFRRPRPTTADGRETGEAEAIERGE